MISTVYILQKHPPIPKAKPKLMDLLHKQTNNKTQHSKMGATFRQ